MDVADRLRLLLRDKPALVDRTITGDGLTNAFLLPERNITTGSAYITGSAGWSGTGATYNPSGEVQFSAVIGANVLVRLRFVASVWSDTEIADFASEGLYAGARRAAYELLFDSTKRARWAAPDGTSFDDTAAIRAVEKLIDVLNQQQGEEVISGGGYAQWSENQPNVDADFGASYPNDYPTPFNW